MLTTSGAVPLFLFGEACQLLPRPRESEKSCLELNRKPLPDYYRRLMTLVLIWAATMTSRILLISDPCGLQHNDTTERSSQI